VVLKTEKARGISGVFYRWESIKYLHIIHTKAS
jgi:hypothetical protein